MKRLHPVELQKNNSYIGYKSRQVIAMAEHYGFVHSNEGKDGKHLRYTHRDYHDLMFNLQSGSDEVTGKYVKDVVAACLEVKRRNALRKEPVFEPIPEWVWKALPDGTRFTKSDNRVEFEAHAIVDLDATEMGPVQHYLLALRDGKLSIRNSDYPLGDSNVNYTVRDGSANVQGLKSMFEQVEARVVQRVANDSATFKNLHDRLIVNHGYSVAQTNSNIGVPYMVFSHPLYASKLDISTPKKGQAIPEETLASIHELLEESRERCLEQMNALEELEGQGWRIEQRPPNGSAAALLLSHADGRYTEVPTYGMHAVFDTELLQKRVQEAGASVPKPVVTETEHLASGTPGKIPLAESVAREKLAKSSAAK